MLPPSMLGFNTMKNSQGSAIPYIKGGKIVGVTKLANDTLKLATKIKKQN